MTPYMISKKFLPSTSYPFTGNRWGIPSALSLLGGGENASDYSSALSKSSTWGNNSFSAQNQLPANSNRSTHRSTDQTNSVVTKTNQDESKVSNQQQKKISSAESHNFNRKSGENSWAHVAGKGLDSIPNNERVQFLYDVLLSPEGWSKDNVNQESEWDLPPSPGPIAEPSFHSRLNVNNGCDVWKNTKETRNASGSSWEQGNTNNKQDDTQNSWLEYSPVWRNTINEMPENNWTGQKVNVSLDQPLEINPPKASLTTNLTTATHSIPSISSSSSSGILPNSYSLGPFTHKETQVHHGQSNAIQNTKDSGIGSTSSLASTVQLPLDCGPVKPKQAWDSVSNETSGYLGSHQIGPQWVTMPNHSIPDHHLMSSQSHTPLIAPHMPHTIYKPDQMSWPQVPNQEYQSDYPSGWSNIGTSNASTLKHKGQSLQLDNLDDVNRDNAQPISSLLSQIEYAVRAGYLSYNIYNEPLAPNTILLLNHLLSAINFLHKLLQQQATLQPQAQINKNAQQQFLLVNGHINKIKQQIQYLQNQISNQQSMYLRQQPSQLPSQAVHNVPIANPTMNAPSGIKGNIPDSLLLNFGQLGIGGNDANGWKSSNVSNKIQPPNMFMVAPERQWGSQVKEPVWHMSNSSNACLSPSMRVPSDPSWSQHNVQPHEFEIKSFQSGKPWLVKNMQEYSPSSTLSSKPNSDMLNLTKSKPVSRVDDTGEDHITTLGLGGSSTWTYNAEGQRNSADLRRKVSQTSVRKDLPWSESRLNSDSWAACNNQTSVAKKPSCWDSSWPNGATASSTQWSNGNISTWLVLKNLTPEVDGSTLKTLCLQHGPLVNFHVVSNYGFALVNYGNKEEAIKAQSNLNNCLLSNTTILAEFATQSEVNELLNGIVLPATTTWSQTTKTVHSTSTKVSSTSKTDCWPSNSSLWANGSTSALWSGSSRDVTDPVSELATKTYLPKNMLNMEPI